jgi:hypothetical protein
MNTFGVENQAKIPLVFRVSGVPAATRTFVEREARPGRVWNHAGLLLLPVSPKGRPERNAARSDSLPEVSQALGPILTQPSSNASVTLTPLHRRYQQRAQQCAVRLKEAHTGAAQLRRRASGQPSETCERHHSPRRFGLKHTHSQQWGECAHTVSTSQNDSPSHAR